MAPNHRRLYSKESKIQVDKKDFDYTPKMIRMLKSETGEGVWRSQFGPIVDMVVQQWPSMGDGPYCSDCIHWVKKNKTHGERECEMADYNYCLTHGKCYWRSKHKEKQGIFFGETRQQSLSA